MSAGGCADAGTASAAILRAALGDRSAEAVSRPARWVVGVDPRRFFRGPTAMSILGRLVDESSQGMIAFGHFATAVSGLPAEGSLACELRYHMASIAGSVPFASLGYEDLVAAEHSCRRVLQILEVARFGRSAPPTYSFDGAFPGPLGGRVGAPVLFSRTAQLIPRLDSRLLTALGLDLLLGEHPETLGSWSEELRQNAMYMTSRASQMMSFPLEISWEAPEPLVRPSPPGASSSSRPIPTLHRVPSVHRATKIWIPRKLAGGRFPYGSRPSWKTYAWKVRRGPRKAARRVVARAVVVDGARDE